MYTNINKDSGHNTLKSMFESLELHEGKVDMLLQAVDLANNHNYVEFDNRFFHKLQGIAMCTACTPDITNLVLGNREHYKKIPFCQGVILYARYIDDSQDPYFHILTNGRQCNVVLYGLLAHRLILHCSPGSGLGLRPLLSSLAQAILTHIQNVSAALPLGLCDSVMSSSGRRLGCL
jgi:hypothetical protein